MVKKVGLLVLLVKVILGCNLVSIKKETSKPKPPIASVNKVNLYKEDISTMVPKKLTKQDSVVLVKSIINSWATEELFFQKAQENISLVTSTNIENLVNEYRKSLYINGYKERLIKQQLDTVVSENEIYKYYSSNKENFKLNENLLQFSYVHYGTGFLDEEEVIKQFTSDKEEDKIALEEKSLSFKSYRLNDSTWVPLNYVKEKIPLLRTEPKEKLLKISKFIQKEDSLGVYLVAVTNVLQKTETAPLSYVSARIKQIVLHKRKIELIRKIEKTLINDAIKNKNFKEY